MKYAALACSLFIIACGGGKGGGTDTEPDAGTPSPGSDATPAPEPDAPAPPADAAPVCGNGVTESGEQCDDGNTTGGDGCSATCQTESGFSCTSGGGACVRTQICGDRIVETGEGCDDGNTTDGDGCSASCALEAGWTCPVPGIRCTAAACGDGIVAGFEQCDDGNTTDGDGCSSTCTLEAGWACPVPAASCHQTVCGDGITEGTEECDDQNNDLGDGCDPFCQREPECTDGTCIAVCGDGVIQPGEACDDGNLFNADGCSSTCTVETGFACSAVSATTGSTLDVTIVYRDFIGHDITGGHIDFENANGGETGIVQANLGADGKPVYNGNPNTSTTHGQATFDQWYRDTPGVNLTYPSTLTLTQTGPGTYVFDNGAFFPLDNLGWVAAGAEPARVGGHNFSFTSELRYWFTYQGGEQLSFRGDDDVWVFINGHLAVDLGGVHGAENGSVTLSGTTASNLGLTVGGTYEAVVFQAERHTSASSYKLTLVGFNAQHSACDDTCGDGVTSSNEVCDDGVDMGGYNSCTADCLGFGPRCGDGIVQAANEQCDDGVNAGGYDHCMPNCTLGPRCGDGIVQADEGEQCDDANDDPNDGCDHCYLPIM
ncbi:MAG TPA: DUF4215 domain-containing protein [Kofleriaceae bacterium]